MDKRAEYMIAWREKKIRHLEQTLRVYEEMLNICLAICNAVSDGERISKEKVRQAMMNKYDIHEDGEYYIVTRREDGQSIKEKEH